MDPLFPETSTPDGAVPLASAFDFGNQFGLLPREKIELMVRRGMISSPELEDAQFQPASLDLRLGARAYRVRASFLPGKERAVQIADALNSADDEISLEGKGAVLERGCVYVIPLIEHLKLARQHFGDRQSQKLDRAARHFHTAHHRQIGCLRPRGTRL